MSLVTVTVQAIHICTTVLYITYIISQRKSYATKSHMPQKVAIYIRVSTQEQVQEGYSIDAQTDRLQAYCRAKD